MSISNLPNTIDSWKKWLETYQVNPNYPDDIFALKTCQLALQAVASGNFGIGCILVDPENNIVASGHNEVFYPYFRSDFHAEMVVINKFEQAHQQITSMRGFTLYTSLEPCPMCMARLINSGCEKILYVAHDIEGGMVHLQENLPSIWRELASSQTFAVAKCSPELQQAAHNILMLNAQQLNQRLLQR